MFVPVSQHIFHVLNLPLQLSRHNSLLWSCATKMTISKTNRPGPGSIREMGHYGKWVFSELAKRWEFGGQEWHWFCHMWAKSVQVIQFCGTQRKQLEMSQYCQYELLLLYCNFRHMDLRGTGRSLGPVSISEKTSFRKISQSLEAARFVFRIVRSLWNVVYQFW